MSKNVYNNYIYWQLLKTSGLNMNTHKEST